MAHPNKRRSREAWEAEHPVHRDKLDELVRLAREWQIADRVWGETIPRTPFDVLTQRVEKLKKAEQALRAWNS